MRTRRLATHMLTAALVTLPLTTSSTGTAEAAQQTPAASTRIDPQGNVIKGGDIDGDGRWDVTTFTFIRDIGNGARFQLTVKTAQGRTASLPVTVRENLGEPAATRWLGLTGIDGIRGNEIVLNLGVPEGSDVRTYAWRKGKLVLVPAAGGSGRSVDWPWEHPDFGRAVGFTFSQTKAGAREVVKHDFTASSTGHTFRGTNTRYRWVGSGWSRVSAAKATVSRKVATSYVGMSGLIWR